jgi:hypothetical protein
VDKCVACQFYDRHDPHVEDKGVRWGQCRRSGPMVHPVSAKTYMVEGIWPHVRDDDWCGEWVAMKRKAQPPSTDPMNLLMPAVASPIRTSTTGAGSLMSRADVGRDRDESDRTSTTGAGSLMAPAMSAGDLTTLPIGGRFGSG